LNCTDIKLDNILVNWTCDEEGTKTITDVALGDFDVAWKCPTNAAITGPHAVGNYMWRSPEAQTVRGMSKASDVFSFGLVVSLPKLFSCIIISELTLSVSTVHIHPRAGGRDTYT
jgi:serine/threonine protein kinase